MSNHRTFTLMGGDLNGIKITVNCDVPTGFELTIEDSEKADDGCTLTTTHIYQQLPGSDVMACKMSHHFDGLRVGKALAAAMESTTGTPRPPISE